MNNDFNNIEERIASIKKAYDTIDLVFDKLPDSINNKYVKAIKEEILNNKELDELVRSLDEYRAPRILIIGRTGFGKSSLINSMFEGYVAEVNDVKSCTKGTVQYSCRRNGGVPLEIMDTRGIAESDALDDDISAEEQILHDIEKFNPDVALLVLSCASRDGIDKDIEFVKDVKKRCYDKDAIDLPVIVAANKADCVAPTRETVPFSKEKLESINHIVSNLEILFEKNKLNVDNIIAVSSCIDWKTKNGKELKNAEQLNKLFDEEKSNLQISFDGRFNIDELKIMLEDAVSNSEANMGIRMAFHLQEMLEDIANRFVNVFSTIAAAVAAVSLPVQHYFALVALEAVLVSLIMALSGRDVDMEAAKEFISGLCGVGAAGKAFSQIAEVLVKFIKGPGDAISAAIAVAGMKMIGKAAIEYFIKGQDFGEVKKQFNNNAKAQRVKNTVQKTAKSIIKFSEKNLKHAKRNVSKVVTSKKNKSKHKK